MGQKKGPGLPGLYDDVRGRVSAVVILDPGDDPQGHDGAANAK